MGSLFFGVCYQGWETGLFLYGAYFPHLHYLKYSYIENIDVLRNANFRNYMGCFLLWALLGFSVMNRILFWRIDALAFFLFHVQKGVSSHLIGMSYVYGFLILGG